MKVRFILIFTVFCFILLFYGACAVQKPLLADKPQADFPAVQREFRAAWIASVANINWPSKAGLSTEEQKAEALTLLDLLKKLNFNAAILQVRPQCDALYASEFEPWSYYLTGQQGKAPDPYYDPLQFWIEEAHIRGLELHAWLNPYRAHHVSGGEVSAFSIVNTHPDLVIKLSSGYYWMDPANPETQQHSYNVVMDIVNRYDVDGIHFDDYFYPYPSYNADDDFPDDKSWQAYLAKGGLLSRADWRRESVNMFIRRVYEGLKKHKATVKFGLSPFGIWRPGNPPSIKGFDQYDKLYADARLWLNEGWIDYFTPQLYWPVNKIPQSFPVLLGWWEKENSKKRHLWPGISTGRLQGEKAIDETINQIMITRGMLPQSPGIVHWSIGPLLAKDTLAHAILNGPYKRQALIPASPWLDNQAPITPQITTEIKNDSLVVKWSHENSADIFHWVIYYKYGPVWDYTILSRAEHAYTLPLFILNNSSIQKEDVPENIRAEMLETLNQLAISAVDMSSNESKPAQAIVTGIDSLKNISLDKLFPEKP